jgi:anhydro-N-acetylmuramic acid kinase
VNDAPLAAIGVMSGTSMDGIDVAWILSDGEAFVETGPAATYRYPARVADELRAVVADPELAAGPLVKLERAVTDAHVAAVENFFAEFGVDRRAVALVGLHGQTILHRPREKYTRQLFDGARAAEQLKIDVVSHFRSADVLAGGEGAPLIPLYHAAIAAKVEKPAMILNWGGVGNVTYLGADGAIVAFDTGPANALIDDFSRRRRGLPFDDGGKLAASGRVDEAIVAKLLDDPYFLRAAPKSLDRNHFHAALAAVDRLSDADGAATLSAFTVSATAAALRQVGEPPKRWIVCGGGRRNATLMQNLAARLNAPVEPIEVFGFDGDAIEAQGFGYLAIRVFRGLPLTLPMTTGARKPMTGGVVWRVATP